MVELTRSQVFAAIEEDTEGTLKDATAASFIPLRDGFSFESAVETVDSDELIAGSIGASKSFIAKEAPVASMPKYFRHSGVEGQAPEYSVVLKSAMGNQTDNSTEYDTVGGSTAGTSAARGTVVVDSGEGSLFQKGQGLLIKSGVSNSGNYSVRNVHSIDTDTLNLSFNTGSAPASGVNLGKAIHFSPGTTHPTFSAHLYQQSGADSAFYQAMAGCRTTSLGINFNANDLAEINFDFAGIQYFFNPITITSSNDHIDFNDGGGEENVTVTQKVYNNPNELAREIASKMGAATGDTITCTYSNTNGKFTIASDGGTLSLLWNTGANTANTIAASIGFSAAADDTGATSYEGDSALTFNPSVSPSYDTEDSVVVRSSELLIGDFSDFSCRGAQNASFTIDTPKTDEDSICADSGVSSSITNERTATFSAQLTLNKYDAGLFDKFINNTTTSIAFTSGRKSAGDWVAGSVINVYMPNASITAHTIGDSDGYQVIQLEASGFVDNSNEDVHLNFL